MLVRPGDLAGGVQVYFRSFAYLVEIWGVSSGPRPFRFFNAWDKDPELHKVVKNERG